MSLRPAIPRGRVSGATLRGGSKRAALVRGSGATTVLDEPRVRLSDDQLRVRMS